MKTATRAYAFEIFGFVLGEDDEKGEGKDEEDEDEGDDDDSNGSGNKEDSDDSEDEDEDEDEDENDDADSEDSDDEKDTEHVEQTRTDSNGIRTVIKKEAEGNKVKYEIVKYGADGKKIEERKVESKPGDETQLNMKTFSDTGGKLSEVKYKSKDGEEIKLMIRDADKTKTFVRYDENHNSIKIIQNPSGQKSVESEDETEMGDEDEVEIEFDEDSDDVEISHNGKSAHVQLPVSIDDDTGSVILTTSQGDIELTQLPDEVEQKIRSQYEIRNVERVRIREQEDKKLVYELTAEKAEKLLGLFEVNIPLLVEYDAQTGELVNSTQTFMQQLLDTLSF